MLTLQLTGQSFLIAVLSVLWTSVSGVRDYDIQKFDLQQPSDIPITGTLKMFRGENRVYKFNMTATITSDDLTIYDVEAEIYHSPLGNNQFALTPFKVPRKRLCDVFNNEYRDRVMDQLAVSSNLPVEHDRRINYCDLLEKGNNYEMINYVPDVTQVPPFAPTGTYKFVGTLIDRNTNSVALSVLVLSKLY